MWFCIVCITAVVREARVEKKKTVVCVIVLANRTRYAALGPATGWNENKILQVQSCDALVC